MEQEEEKNIIIEFQRKVLQEANCTAEMLAYLDEIDDDVFREYYCICALDGMTVEEIRRIDSIAVQDWRVKIKHIKEERLNFLENMFVPNSEMQKQISELHDKAGKVFQETEELRITLNATLQQTLDIQKNALMEQRESYQNSLAAKEELIKERDEKIQSLVNEIEQNKKTWQTEKKTLLLQLGEKKSSDDDKEEQKEVPSKKENSVRDVTEKKKRCFPAAFRKALNQDKRKLLITVCPKLHSPVLTCLSLAYTITHLLFHPHHFFKSIF